MINDKLIEVLTTPPDAALAIVTQGQEGPHVVNSWNSYVSLTDDEKIAVPAGRMFKTEENLESDNRVYLTIANRNVEGKTYKGTGFLIIGTAEFLKEGIIFDTVKAKFPWARAALTITVGSLEQTL